MKSESEQSWKSMKNKKILAEMDDGERVQFFVELRVSTYRNYNKKE